MGTTGNQNTQIAQNSKTYTKRQVSIERDVSRKTRRDYKTEPEANDENSIGGGFNNFMKSDSFADIAKGMGSITSSLTQFNTDTNQTSLAVRDGISDAAIQSGIPIAMAIGAAAKGLDAIADTTGWHINDINKDVAERADINGGTRLLNNAMNVLPGNTLLMYGLSKATGTKPTDEALALNESGQQMRGAYSGAMKDIDAANSVSGKMQLFGLGRNKLNRFIGDTNQKTQLINEIGETNTLAKKSDYNTNLAQQNKLRYSGTNYMQTAIGRNGMKLPSRAELQKILSLKDKIKELKKGGVVGTDSNLIPEGALHARLNHLQDGDKLEDTTRKGIPVLDAKGNQIAEIEHSEIIFRLELTKKIEELMKDGSEEAMIEAGKILTKELITNTQDNSGVTLTEEVENG